MYQAFRRSDLKLKRRSSVIVLGCDCVVSSEGNFNRLHSWQFFKNMAYYSKTEKEIIKDESKPMGDLVIGIDLGTTNSCAAYYYKNRVNILINEEGGRITPSYLFFPEKGGVVVGHYAKRMADAKPQYGIYEIKRLVGRKFDDPYLQNNLRYFHFKICNDLNNPVVLIERPDANIRKTPQELCTSILEKIKKDVEAKLGQVIDKAVITVPAYFNVTQREVTLAAAKQAGFTVLKLLNEPTAAALSYYLENDSEVENYSLVYDLGGGTFDVAVLKRNSNNIDIIAVDGDTHLGGHDFDNLILDYVCEKLKSKYKFNPKSNTLHLRRLRHECEEAKKVLSVTEETTIVLNGFVRRFHTIKINLTRKQFENMADELFQRTIDIVDCCLKNSKIKKFKIKEVIMSGGSTRIPKIQKMICDYFDGKAVNKFVNPDECVAEGAALQAAMLSRNPKQTIDKIKITDVVPLSLGIADFVDKMIFYIKKNSTLPISATSRHITVNNKQTSMTFQIYEGERLNAKKNHHLGTFEILNITPAPPSQCTVMVNMNIDENGILTVAAKEEHRNNIKELTITYTRGHRSGNEIKNALKDAEENEKEDEHFQKFAALKEYLLKYCEGIKYNLEEKKLKESHSTLYELCDEVTKEAYGVNDGDDIAVNKLTETIKEQCEPCVRRYKFKLMPSYVV